MRKVIVTEFATVDGVVEDPGGSEGMEGGGWALETDRGEEGDRFKLDELTEADALLLGRVTYEGFAAAWPTREGAFADTMNAMRKYVVSATLKEPSWNNTVRIADDVPGSVARLKEEPGGDILVAGSVRLVRTLMEHDLVDEYRLMVFPLVLGHGKRLFPDAGVGARLELAEARAVGDGVVILVYHPRRES